MILFNQMGLSPGVLRAVEDLGYEIPTPVQEQTIPALLEQSRDIVAYAQTGTGKTAAFGLPVVQQVDCSTPLTQALVLCPTRELCMQITRDLSGFAKYLPSLQILPVYGGASIGEQIRKLERGAQVVVATPGRAVDLIRRKKLDLSHVRWLVLDEADEMLSMGFKDDLDFILAATPPARQTLLFSATMPPEMVAIANKYMTHPLEISVGKKNTGAENVAHEYFMVHAKDRYEALKRIADLHPRIYGIVFCRTRAETREVADNLIRDGYNADALHGDLSQEQRDIVMNRFRNRHLQLLVATDVAARGLDVNDLSHVINYNLPDDPEVYIHRSGRTGRAGKKGTAYSILHLREKGKLRDVERMLGRKIEYKTVPSGREICEKQLFNLVDRVENVEVNDQQIDQYLKVIYKKLEWLDRDDLIKHFVSVEFNRFLASYENAPDLNADLQSRQREEKPESRRKEERGKRGGDFTGGTFSHGRTNQWKRDRDVLFSRFFLNLGKTDQVDKRGIIDLINRQMPGRSVEIGAIEILRDFSFFEVDQRYGREVQKAFQRARYNGKRLGLESARPKE
ncbi:MAG: DEAD/DEAH box helicase [Prolixibacteraceae bacterium]|jgi:ATP-dependent RNA helicase DeaD|nr:DEAD/DEAH box helicase [Prolixibacteraceae bacterium]NLX28824.1 DEAD/DEAH box helicase [Bacteroidales bacterium]HNQ38082.1 DEAD/DEAH box helicase [Prolixibacteraceae bacterium]HPJ77429.1 DEAD/DEAH box helicase [Prolixibacteraceae bacterium]HRV88909.1 DEAD/DEAH box helicase [Prolixibacteraceae bacterium]